MKSTINPQHLFARVPTVEIPRSTFDRSHGWKGTFDSGYLIPFYVDEALPGDTFNLRMNAFCRLATPLKPIMDNMFLETFFFAVPYRLVWSNWEKFNGAQVNPGDSTSYVVPQCSIASPGVQVGDLQDYMGLPTGVTGGPTVFNNLHCRAANLIWNTWFRDENLQNSLVVDTGDGPDTYSNYVLQRRGKRHDYFTSCLPWPQKGTAVTLPLGTSAPVIVPTSGATPAGKLRLQTTSALSANGTLHVGSGGGSGAGVLTNNDTGLELFYDPNGSMIADLSSATAATINAIRQAFQLQRMFERDARGGTRYTEIILSHFGVRSDDARLQRPEYLGGGSSPINVHPVPQTSPVSGGSTPQGNLAAFGTSSVSGHGFTKSFTEHCLLLGFMNVRADLTYQQGMNRMWSRRTRFDFYWPSLAHLGEQGVLNSEIFYQGTSADALVFGYQERYGEYRFKPSQITGKFRSTYSTPLDYWHLAQKFSSLPTLGSTFIVDQPPIDRVIAVPSEPQFLADVFIDLKCARPMPVYGVPGLIDHF